MRLDAERSSTYRIFAEYRADRPELQLEKRAAPALKARRRASPFSVSKHNMQSDDEGAGRGPLPPR